MIEWDADAQVVQRATSGILEIKDLGDGATPVRLDLGREILRTGSVLYSKPSDKVSIRLQLVDGEKHISESMVYFLAREQPPPKLEIPASPAQTRYGGLRSEAGPCVLSFLLKPLRP